MKTRPVVPRIRATRDVEEIIDRYVEEDAARAALRFVAALKRAYRFIARRPSAGSPRYAEELDLPGLRTWRIARFPYVIFYVERETRIDVWRVLHEHRDLPATLREREH